MTACQGADTGALAGKDASAPVDVESADDDAGCGETAQKPCSPTSMRPSGVEGEAIDNANDDDAGTGLDGGKGERDPDPSTRADGAMPLPEPPPPPPKCEVTAPTGCPDTMPTYDNIRPIIEARCVGCHYGEVGGPWPLTSYGHVADWHDIIRGVMLNCTMPPPEKDTGMTVAERVRILEWLRCGYPK